MRDFNDLFDVGELHLSVVVDSEDRVFDMGVRFKTIFIELDLGGSFLDTIRIILMNLCELVHAFVLDNVIRRNDVLDIFVEKFLVLFESDA